MATTTATPPSSGTLGTHTFYKSTKKDIQKKLRYVAKNAVILGRMDGWDELAVATATVLPAYARPLFLTATLTGLTFPVLEGAKGMAAEFQEMKDNVQGLKNKQIDLALKLLASDHTPEHIKAKLITEFDAYNEHNELHLDKLKNLKPKIDAKENKDKACEITKIFKKLDIKFDASDDVIEKLLKKDDAKSDKYQTLKQARDLITQYQEADREGKTTLEKQIEAFIKPKDDTFKLNANDWNWTKDKKINDALTKIADDILTPRRDEYIIKLFNDYDMELDNKAKLKAALDNSEDTKDLLNSLKITPYTPEQAQSDILQYERNAKKITIEQTPVTGYLGNAAMSGMTLGTALSAAKAGTQLLGQFGVLPNLMPALTAGLELASSGTFVASQAAMVGYGLGEAYKGYKKNKLLEEDKEALKQAFANDKDLTATQKEQLAHIEELQKYNTRQNTIYGIGIAAAEAGMIAGSLTGSSPLLMAAALGTLACAGLRVWTQSAESNLTGDAHDHDHDGKPLTLLLNPLKEPEIERAIDDTGTSKTVDVCGDANCKTDHESFELDNQKLDTGYTNNLSSLDNALKELNYIISNNFKNVSVTHARNLFHELVPNTERKKPKDKNILGSFGQQMYNKDETYINAIIDNPTALEEAKEILIDVLEEKDHKNNAQRPYTKEVNDDLEALRILKSNRPDENALRKLLTDNLALLDKPQNAKTILKPLLQERIEKLTAKKHSQIQNMIHLQKIRERERERENKQV